MNYTERKFSIVERLQRRSLIGERVDSTLFSDFCDKSYSLFKKDMLAHFGCVNAVEFSNDGTIFVSGSDDRRVLLWSINEALSDRTTCVPVVMEAEHGSNVFCLSVSCDNSRVFSGGNDFQTIVHDAKLAKPVDYFLHEKPVYGISLQPHNQSVFATACEDGKLRIFDLRSSTSSETILASKRSPFHSVMFHPVESRIVASANARDGAELWDLRNPLTCLYNYPSEKGAMSVRFNSLGDKLLCLCRREPPKIFPLYKSIPTLLYAKGYSNACTMKSCCFAGSNDEYAISGSDDHNIYVWKIPALSPEIPDDCILPLMVYVPHMVLRGHRSVVNHVRYNPNIGCLASCGVEKMVKIWSPIAYPNSSGGLDRAAAEEPKPRKRLSRSSRECNMIIAPSPNFRSTDEDKKMLAFFDLLVERSAVLSSDDEDEFSDESDYQYSDDSELDEESENNTSRSRSQSNSDDDEVDDSFEIDSLSTPSSSPSSVDTEEEPIAGPSGLGRNSSTEDEPLRLELPFGLFAQQRSILRRCPGQFSSSEDEDTIGTANSEVEHTPVNFRPVSNRTKRQFRRRTSSTSSSS